MKKTFAMLIVFAMLLSVSAWAVSLTSVKINQTVQSGEDLYVFFHATDENENTIGELTTEDVKVDLAGQTLPVEMSSIGTEGIGYVFAIDVSASLSEEQFDSVQECMNEWINAMNASDQAAIVTFGDEVVTVTDFTDNKNTLSAVISGLNADAGGTMLYSGVMKAIDIAKRQSASLPLQRVVVLMSDGVNEGNDTSSLAEMRGKALDAGIPLYVAGVRGDNNSDKLAELGEVARTTGGMIYTSDKNELAKGFQSLSEYLRSGFIASVKIPTELADGSQKGLTLTVNLNGIGVDDSVDLRVKGIDETAAEAPEGETQDGESGDEAPEEGEEPTEGLPEEDAEDAEDAEEAEGETAEATEPGEEETAEGTAEEDAASGTDTDAASETSAEDAEGAGDEAEDAEPAEGSGGGLRANSLYIYIGAGVLVVAGVAVYVFLMLRKRKDKDKQRSKQYDNGYGGTGGAGIQQGTIPMSSGTVPMGDFDGATVVGGVIVLMDSEKGRSYSTQKKDRITIGRNESNDIVIPDGKVSGNHCELLWDGVALHVVDKGSTNGTFVISNGLRYSVDSYAGHEFNLGDELLIGGTRLELSGI